MLEQRLSFNSKATVFRFSGSKLRKENAVALPLNEWWAKTTLRSFLELVKAITNEAREKRQELAVL